MAGIGIGIALGLAQEGDHVAMCARRPARLDAIAAAIHQATGRQILAIPADLTNPADAEHVVHTAAAALGRIDLLVHTTGAAPGGTLDVLTEEHWAAALQRKCLGSVRCTRHTLPSMITQGGAVWSL